LPQFAVDGADQLLRHVVSHLLSGDADRGRALLQGAEQIGPEAHQAALLLQLEALALQGRGASVAAPEGLVVIAGLRTEGDPVAQGPVAGLTVGLAQAGEHQQAAGMHCGDAIEAPQFGQTEPVARGRRLSD